LDDDGDSDLVVENPSNPPTDLHNEKVINELDLNGPTDKSVQENDSELSGEEAGLEINGNVLPDKVKESNERQEKPRNIKVIAVNDACSTTGIREMERASSTLSCKISSLLKNVLITPRATKKETASAKNKRTSTPISNVSLSSSSKSDSGDDVEVLDSDDEGLGRDHWKVSSDKILSAIDDNIDTLMREAREQLNKMRSIRGRMVSTLDANDATHEMSYRDRDGNSRSKFKPKAAAAARLRNPPPAKKTLSFKNDEIVCID